MSMIPQKKRAEPFNGQDEPTKPAAKPPRLLETKKMSTIESQESTELDTITCDLPTITITEEDELDELEHTLNLDLAAGELVSSDEEHLHGFDSLPRDPEAKSLSGRSAKAGAAIKTKVTNLVGKVKDIFHKESTPRLRSSESVASERVQAKALSEEPAAAAAAQQSGEIDYAAQALLSDLKAKEEALIKELEKRQRELSKKESELLKKEEKATKAADEKVKKAEDLLKKEEERIRKEAEKAKKVEELAAKRAAEAAKKKEEELRKREEEQIKKDAELKRRDEELKRKEKELRELEKEQKRQLDDAKKRVEQEKREAERELREAEKQKQKKQLNDEIKIEQAAYEAQELDEKIRKEKLELEKQQGYVFEKPRKLIKKLIGSTEEDSLATEERALAVDESITEDLRTFAQFNMGYR